MVRSFVVNTAILTFLLQAGCIRTEINQDLSARASGKPYRNILVCSMSKDPQVGAQVESTLRKDLVHHHVAVEMGRHLLYAKRNRDTDSVVVEIKKHHIDGVLITQRIEVPVSSSTLKDVILGPSLEQQPAHEVTESFMNVQEFMAAYLRLLRNDGLAHAEQQLKASMMQEGIVGKEIAVHARADLLGVREGQIVWSNTGLIEGSPHRPIREFIDSFAKTIESGLVQAKFLPD